jgi:hypothetical protein
VLLISSVTGQGLSQVVGRLAQLLAEMKRDEAEADRRRKPTEFPTEKAIRTEEGVVP